MSTTEKRCYISTSLVSASAGPRQRRFFGALDAGSESSLREGNLSRARLLL